MALSFSAQTMSNNISSKTILLQNNPNLKSQIKSYFISTYQIYQQLFEAINSEQAYYIRPQPLRHPLIFYYAHTAAVYINKFIDYGIIRERVNPQYQKIFAVGVDEMDWDDLNQTSYNWPSLPNARKFRQQVKQLITSVIQSISCNKIDNWINELYVVLLGIEHERIHLQTSAVIMRRLPLKYITPMPKFVQCSLMKKQIKAIPKNRMVQVKDWKGKMDRSVDSPRTFGWDNQFGEKYFDVKGFKASEMLVSNGEYLKFVNEGGYCRPQLWTEEGQRWLASIKPNLPLFWRKQGENYKLRTLYRQIDMPWDWPAEVNNLQARAFCKWRTQKTGNYTRLPTQDEYYIIRSQLKSDQPDWDYQSVGNINMQLWMSPNPVNMFKNGDFYDIVGNVWQHTITPIYPFDRFQIHPAYEDFTSYAFDQRHDLIKGGSFISTGNMALYHTRQPFRRHFYQFAGIRYIQTSIQMQIDKHCSQIVNDNNVEMNLRHHYMNNNSYIQQVVQKLKAKIGSKQKHKKVLTVGCSVGRIPMELSTLFGQSVGMDYTTRYFQMATRLLQKGVLKFKDIDIDLKKMDMQTQKVSFVQMNPVNPDEKKLNNFDWIVIDGYALKNDTIDQVLSEIDKLAARDAKIAVINVENKNYVSKEKMKYLLMKGCDEKEQVEEQRLAASDQEQSYLPDYTGNRTFWLKYYKLLKN